MQTRLVIIAVASALAAPAIAAPCDAPYALRAVHADFETQLEPGAIGTAGHLAADLLAAQNAAQERLVLPLLVGSMQARAVAEPFEFPATAGPLYGPGPFPMMGVGDPHPLGKGN